jgi:SRSO17 transposase
MIAASRKAPSQLSMSSELPILDADQLARLDEYVLRYRDLFARADQAKSFGLYVRGLLSGSHRKNVESIAEQVQDVESDADLAQSLQHFVSQSPWDAEQVVARYRTQLVSSSRKSGRIWIIHDGMVPKKGRHSVGVHRQFARSLGRKVNCQVAVVVSEGGDALVPLSMRLYLPASWLRDHQASAERIIPEAHRRAVAKPDVALEIIDELLETCEQAPIIAEESYTSSPSFVDGIAARGLTLLCDEDSPLLNSARSRFDWLKDALGLSHFEGRTWTGWHHHAALVLSAYGFLIHESVAIPAE